MPSSNISHEQALESFQCATDENQLEPLRKEQVVTLPEEGEVIICGDLHDHRRNWEKLLRYADLDNNPQRHLVLQELIHGEHYDNTGAEESWMTLMAAAELKCDHPRQVHFLLANHDLAQIHGKGIVKGSTSVCEAFNLGVKRAFGEHRALVHVAITEFLLSFPLAIALPSGIFLCHSIPTDDQIPAFDYSIFDRKLTGPDYARRTGPVYQLIWGRHTTPPFVSMFAENLATNMLITGHQPQDMGYSTNGDQHLIIASDNNQGVFLHLDLAQTYDIDSLVRHIRKFVALDV